MCHKSPHKRKSWSHRVEHLYTNSGNCGTNSGNCGKYLNDVEKLKVMRIILTRSIFKDYNSLLKNICSGRASFIWEFLTAFLRKKAGDQNVLLESVASRVPLAQNNLSDKMAYHLVSHTVNLQRDKLCDPH